MPSFDPHYYQSLRDDQHSDLDNLRRHLANYGDALSNVRAIWHDQAAQRVERRYINELQTGQENLLIGFADQHDATANHQHCFDTLLSDLMQCYQRQDSLDDCLDAVDETEALRDRAERRGIRQEEEYADHHDATQAQLNSINSHIEPI
ncbi:hypothetical protein [Photobacterium nomapromontoriensis]|uniref:hypothetical protein n=1 Tax=Photobacterium nomapromontoriensis TaxID=2910237 RepID=UPI003D1445D6